MTDNQVIEKALARKKRKHVIPTADLLSSGSTLLNLAASGRVAGCYAKGHYYWFVGDSESGKTWLALVALAEACINKEFDDYRIIYNNAEHGALMSIKRYFGYRVAQRLEHRQSESVEDFYYDVDDANEDGRPFIYILDSMDSIDATEDQAKFKKDKSKKKREQEAGGSYGTAKAKLNSTHLRRVVAGLRRTKSILIVISQVRQNIGFGSQYQPDTIAGGKALKFYCTLKIATKVREKIKRVVRKKKRTIGILSRVRIEKNRISGRDRTIEIPIYYTSGADDIGSCIDFLIEEGHWKGKEASVIAPEFDYDGSKEGLIHKIEEQEDERQLKAIVAEVWADIEKQCEVKRKNKYA